jgi:hypothetical protein
VGARVRPVTDAERRTPRTVLREPVVAIQPVLHVYKCVIFAFCLLIYLCVSQEAECSIVFALILDVLHDLLFVQQSFDFSSL